MTTDNLEDTSSYVAPVLRPELEPPESPDESSDGGWDAEEVTQNASGPARQGWGVDFFFYDQA